MHRDLTNAFIQTTCYEIYSGVNSGAAYAKLKPTIQLQSECLQFLQDNEDLVRARNNMYALAGDYARCRVSNAFKTWHFFSGSGRLFPSYIGYVYAYGSRQPQIGLWNFSRFVLISKGKT